MRKADIIINSIVFIITIFLICCSKEENYDRIEDNFYLRNDGADLPVYVEGNLSSKTFIIVLHGGPGGNAHVYNTGLPEFSDRMEKKFVMVYYDQRGSGVSMGNYKASELTVEKHVEDLDLLISLLDYKYGKDIKIFLFGHSWGGTLGTAYLLQRNFDNRISGWIEADGGHNFFGVLEIIESFKIIGSEQIQDNNSESFWKEVISYCNDIDTSNITDGNISKLNSYAYKAESNLFKDGVIQYNIDSTSLFEYLGGLVNHYFFSPYNPVTSTVNLYFSSSGFGMFHEVKDLEYSSKLKNIDVPTLILWGRYDMVIPVELGEQAYEQIGTVEEYKHIYIFETAGHSPMANYPYEFSRRMIDFVEEYNNR